MASATPHTVTLGGNPITDEALAANGPITPGMLLLRLAAGTVRPHNSAGGRAEALFAVEADYVGAGIDDQYETGETVTFSKCRKGDRVYAFLAAGQDVAKGAFLESNGAGALRAATAGAVTGSAPVTGVTLPGNAVAVALEAVDNDPGTDSLPVRIKVEIL
jgi:hypothetical protein